MYFVGFLIIGLGDGGDGGSCCRPRLGKSRNSSSSLSQLPPWSSENVSQFTKPLLMLFDLLPRKRVDGRRAIRLRLPITVMVANE